jgi:hypothetical protein
MNKFFSSGLFALLFSVLACRPVIAIGWGEFLSLAIVIGILFGPPLYKFIRRIENFRKHEQKDK